MENTSNIPGRKMMPGFLKLLCFVEMWERFSYYGMRALLVLFLTSQMDLADEDSYAIYSLFAALGYSLTALGGFIADRLLGYRKMVLVGGSIITLGHFSLGLIRLEPNLIYFGLALVAVGTGMFKGNITNLLGTCYKENDPNRGEGFTLFHVGVNLGSFLAALTCGYAAHLFGWEYGFGLAGIGMVIGLIVFIKYEDILGDRGLPNPENRKRKILGIDLPYVIFAGAIALAIFASQMLIKAEYFANLLAYTGFAMVLVFFYIIAKSSVQEKRGLITLVILIVFLMCLLALEMQLGSLINLFSARNIDNNIFGYEVPAAISQAINPLSIIILGILLRRFFNFGIKYQALKFLLGILSMALCFLVLYIGCLDADSNGRVSYMYLVVAISIMGLGELFVIPLIQEQATILAPKKIKGLVMGMLMLSLAFSNLAGIIISKFMSIPKVGGEIDSLASLEIYKAGFFKIYLFNLALAVIFMLFYRYVSKTIISRK